MIFLSNHSLYLLRKTPQILFSLTQTADHLQALFRFCHQRHFDQLGAIENTEGKLLLPSPLLTTITVPSFSCIPSVYFGKKP